MPDELFMRAKKNGPNRPRLCLKQSVISDVGSDDGIQWVPTMASVMTMVI